MQFNTSRFNSIGLGSQEKTINNDYFQNEFFSHNYPIVGLGQLGLSQKMTDIRRVYGTPYRVQVHTQIDYFPIQNQQTLPLSEVRVTEDVRTRFLTETSSREHIFVPNGTVHIQSQPSSQNQSVDDFFTRNNPFYGPFYQNPIQNHQALNLGGLTNHTESKRDGLLFPKPISVYDPKANLNPSGNQIPNHNQLGINFQNFSMNESSSNQTSVFNLINPLKAPSLERVPCSSRFVHPVIQNDPNDDYDVEDDGRTHSLPTKKNGPYTCPKCEHVFSTSQCFAAHIRSHYRNESPIERKKRQAARYKKKYLRHFMSPKGLTVMPPSFKMASRKNAYGKGEMAANIKEKEVQKQEKDGYQEGFALCWYED